MAGLRSRLERVEEIEVRSVEHAITLAKYLFGEKFFEKVEEKEKNKYIGSNEKIKIKIPKGVKPKTTEFEVIKKGKHRMVEIEAKIDTGAHRSSIDKKLAEDLGLLTPERILYNRHYRSSLGVHQDRPVVEITFWLKGKKIVTAVNVANRSHLKSRFLIGIIDLNGFMVKIEGQDEK
jgi:hypothetical protein